MRHSLNPNLDHLLDQQSGVVSRKQVLDAGLDPVALRRLVRRRDLNRVHPGVFLSHTGEPTWTQRAWAAVLVAWPAALCGTSALRAYGVETYGQSRDGSAAIQVAVAPNRHPRAWPGVTVLRTKDFDDWVHWSTSPPRIRLEMAAVRLADAAPNEHACVRVLTDVVGARRTTAAHLLRAAQQCSRLRRRAFVVGVLDDITHGTHSVLERAYLHLVERAHGLPPSQRQVRAQGPAGRVLRRDSMVGNQRFVVELDGQTHHEGATARHRDLERDLAAAVDGLQTVRLGWGQVVGDPCSTASSLATLLTRRGWHGTVRRCPRCQTS